MNIKRFVLPLAVFAVFALAGCGGGSSTPTGPSAEELAAMQMREMEQKTALEQAHEMLTMALAPALDTQDELDAANAAHKTLSDAIAAADDVSAADKAKYETAARNAMSQIAQAQKIFDEAETERMAMERERQRMEDAAAAAAMAATAAKLYAGISPPMGDANSPAATDRAADYNEAGTAILVSTSAATAQALSEDKKTTVAAHHGWEGKRYTASGTGVNGTYEAMVWSNVGEPKMGRKFGSAAPVTEEGVYEYELDAADRNGNANKALTIVPATHAASVSLPGVTRTAGTETFNLPDPNTGGAQFINVPGMLHGVSGTFSCDPTTDADGCTAAVAAKGFTLGGGTWLFIPSNAEARVTGTPNAIYASYGWWIHKSADGSTFTASAFVDNKGDVPAATALDTLQGTATYSGGAAGKYALSSSTGGTNDAGHFTADATLEANFNDDTITGTVDNFMGADGMARDWSVELKKNMIGATGPISSDGTATGAGAQTAWTIGGTAASASGSWSGTLYDNGDDGVPKVGTGTFYSTYGQGGKMVGAFGVNKE